MSLELKADTSDPPLRSSSGTSISEWRSRRTARGLARFALDTKRTHALRAAQAKRLLPVDAAQGDAPPAGQKKEVPEVSSQGAQPPADGAAAEKDLAPAPSSGSSRWEKWARSGLDKTKEGLSALGTTVTRVTDHLKDLQATTSGPYGSYAGLEASPAAPLAARVTRLLPAVDRALGAAEVVVKLKRASAYECCRSGRYLDLAAAADARDDARRPGRVGVPERRSRGVEHEEAFRRSKRGFERPRVVRTSRHGRPSFLAGSPPSRVLPRCCCGATASRSTKTCPSDEGASTTTARGPRVEASASPARNSWRPSAPRSRPSGPTRRTTSTTK